MTLFINCCPRGDSRTEKLARALLKTLGEYDELRLYDEPLHPLGRTDIEKRDALLAGKKYDDEMLRYARQFAAADRIVIAAPLWDLSFPAQLNTFVPGLSLAFVTGNRDFIRALSYLVSVRLMASDWTHKCAFKQVGAAFYF